MANKCRYVHISISLDTVVIIEQSNIFPGERSVFIGKEKTLKGSKTIVILQSPISLSLSLCFYREHYLSFSFNLAKADKRESDMQVREKIDIGVVPPCRKRVFARRSLSPQAYFWSYRSLSFSLELSPCDCQGEMLEEESVGL